MNDKQIQQALQQIAATQIPSDTDLWPEIAPKVKRSFRPNIWQWSVRLAGTAVAIFILFLFGTWILSIPQASEIAAISTGTPDVVRLPFSFTAAPDANFPAAPRSLPLYIVERDLYPQTEEEALAWAREFGMSDPKLFKSWGIVGVMLVVDSDGSQLHFREWDLNSLGIDYLHDSWRGLPLGESVSSSEGIAAAQAFLIEHNQLPANYHMIQIFSDYYGEDGYSTAKFHFSPDLNGYPILQRQPQDIGIGATVNVDASGTVFSASFAQAEFTESDTVNLKSVEEVIADFNDSRIGPSWYHREPINIEPEIRSYEPPLPDYTIGEQITILDTRHQYFLVAEDGSEARIPLRTEFGVNYELVTPELANIAESVQNDYLQVTGTIEARLAPDTWRLAVESWEIIDREEFATTFPNGCASGPVRIDESGTWITAESISGDAVLNGQYQLENLPTDIEDGDLIEACSRQLPEVGETMPWYNIYSPPRELVRNSWTPSDEYLIESAQLVYMYDPYDEEPVALTPTWILSGYSPNGVDRIVMYLDATK